MSVACLLLFFNMVTLALAEASERNPQNAAALVGYFERALWNRLYFTMGLLALLTFVLGIFTTFKIVGPLRRLEAYLQSVAAGERPGPLKFRTGDALQEFPDLVNAAMAACRNSIERAPNSTSMGAVAAAPRANWSGEEEPLAAQSRSGAS
jgi:hypothetical protein